VKLALTGIGLVTPLGNSVQDVWRAICAGQSGVGPITAFDASDFPTRIGAEIKDFDPHTWLTPKTVRRTGRTTQLALAAGYLALADSGWSRDIDHFRDAAVIVGSGWGSSASVEEAYRTFFLEGWRKNPMLSVPMCMPNAPGSQLAMEAGFTGPSFTVSAACASGAEAVAQAVHLIRAGVIQRAVVGGCDAFLLPGLFSIWCRLGVLSRRNHDPAGASAPFSRDRDGIVIGEAACVMTIERLADAEKRGAPIYAEVSGVASTCGAQTVTSPVLGAEVAAMRQALADGGISTDEVGYINAHGTGTKLNDAVETAAIKQALGKQAWSVAISSTKSSIGHTMGASSALECAVTALALRDQVLPPTINLRMTDPECDLDYVPNVARPKAFSAALSNSFGFGGSNVTLALRRYAG